MPNMGHVPLEPVETVLRRELGESHHRTYLRADQDLQNDLLTCVQMRSMISLRKGILKYIATFVACHALLNRANTCNDR